MRYLFLAALLVKYLSQNQKPHLGAKIIRLSEIAKFLSRWFCSFVLAMLAQVGGGVFRFWAKPQNEKLLPFYAYEASINTQNHTF
jgi:hypothetical protein